MIPNLFDLKFGEINVNVVKYQSYTLWEREVAHTLLIVGSANVSGETSQYIITYDGAPISTGATWSITSGSNYASINQTGTVTISSSATGASVTISASYSGLTATKDITVSYLNGSSSVTSGETIDNGDGTYTETTTTTITNGDGSSSSQTTSTIVDTNGDVVGTIESSGVTNSDGSSSSTTTNYNADGDPTSTENNEVDTQGNSTTQEIKYDENGDPVVTGYDIDTTNNPNGYKNFNGDGANTEYYAFDVTHGFEVEFDFTIDFSNQPPNQNENHHNILTAKRATPSPWYGFQLRQSSTNKYIQLGTQFSTGNNTNTTISPQLTGNTAFYSLKITYDPTSTGNTFVCKDMRTGNNVYTSTALFPDLAELKYIKVTIGYAMDENGDAFRYSNINVSKFSITRLSNVETPTIYCDGQSITLTCGTVGATIYYKIGSAVNYSVYTSPITITADTYIETYAEFDGDTSAIASETCLYDNGIERPEISCDGENVSIICETPSVDVYYRLNQTGDYSAYTDSFEITADTVVQAYAELNGDTGPIVTQTCVYSPIVVSNPVVTCNGSRITISCATQNAEINYRLDQTGSYSAYTVPIDILQDTVVEAYAQLSGRVSSVVMETCIYNPVHDYSADYLTFKVLTGGTIVWKAFGTGFTKTIEYSLNNGSWIPITASTSPTSINVVANDEVRFRGSNTTYAGSKQNYDGFDGGTAVFNIEGNIMSLIYGDNFVGNTAMTGTYNFCSMFKQTNVVSAENLILPATSLTQYCYRAMFSKSHTLTTPPQLPATTLARGCYYYMFEECAITTAPDLPATTLVQECYYYMFTGCTSLNYIRCVATSTGATNATTSWCGAVASTGTFVKDVNTTWSRGVSGIPTGWTVVDDGTIIVGAPAISCDGQNVTITCSTNGADIYYKTGSTGSFSQYTTAFTITANTVVHAYAEMGGQSSITTSQSCDFVSSVPIEAANRSIDTWIRNGNSIQVPYSVNAIDGHSATYAKGNFNFESSFTLRDVYPTYLLFQHADQSATVYIDNTPVEKHWGGYNSFFVDISNNVHSGTNEVKVVLKNNEGNNLAPAAGDFNYNATLGKVRLLSSPVLPSTDYGYDGFHVTSNVTAGTATVNVKTTVPSGATVTCVIDDGTFYFSGSQDSTGSELTFTTSITGTSLHLWNGTIDPHLYNITVNIYSGATLYHTFQRGYGLRYFDYVINQTAMVNGVSTPNYTGFLLNGQAYLLRGVCLHHDIDGKANALTDTDIANDFSIIQELGCNFLRLAHYPHPKEVYDWCDQLGIIVQTEAPCVNKFQSTMPSAYYEHLEDQYEEMVNHHFNHPSIIFWGLSNETTTDDVSFAKTKIEGYTSLIKSIDPSRMVGYVMSHNSTDPYGYYNSPSGIDWVGGNIYVGWYVDKNSNDPTTELNKRINSTITNKSMALAFSEYGCGGTQHCHSEDPQTTTTKGNYERHDIEYQMWLHEGHIAAIKNYPQLLFTGEWQMFDIAVANRDEGYTICLDGENTSIDDNLRRLNDKGLVERDHVTKKDTFYLYKAWWNPTPFVHICGKDYTKTNGRTIKCYTNQTGTFTLYVNSSSAATATASDNIVTFASRNFNSGDVVRVDGPTTTDTFTFE